MEAKLALRARIKNLNLRLVSRGILFWLTAFLLLPGGIFRTALFIFISVMLYNPLNGIEAFSYFVVLDALLIIMLGALSPVLGFMLIILAAGLFFAVLSIKHVVFHNTVSVAAGGFFILAYGLLISTLAGISGLFVFLVFFTILVFGFLRIALPAAHTERGIAGLFIVLLTTELLVVLRVLPIGFFNLGIILLTIILVAADLIVRYLESRITSRRIVADVAFGVGVCALLFSMSQWLPF